MFAILIVISITSHGHQHQFKYTSKAQYNESTCMKRADDLADRIAHSVAGRVNARVKSTCVPLITRPI